jgi:hypothetical protein
MAIKTVIIKLCKLLPKDSELNEALLANDSNFAHEAALQAGIVAPDNWIAPTDPSKDATNIHDILSNPKPEDARQPTDEEIEADAKLHDAAQNAFCVATSAVAQMGGRVGDILDIPDASKVLETYTASQVESATDILNDWIKKAKAAK